MPSFSLLLKKKLTILKILQVTLFKVIVAAFRKPPVTVKLAPEPGCDSDNSLNCPCMFIKVNFSAVIWEVITAENRQLTEIVSRRKIMMQLSVQVSWFRGFIEVSKIAVFNYFFQQGNQKI